MKVLLTGATSLIGRHVVARLLERGDEVTVVQRNPSRIEGVAEFCHDIGGKHGGAGPGKSASPITGLPPPASGLPPSNAGSPSIDPLDEPMANMDAVVHLAAKVTFSGKWEAFEAINIEGTRRLVDSASRSGVSRFVHVSTPSVAHAGRSLIGEPAGPADPEHVRGHYARSKAFGEKIALAANGPGMRVVALRPHLVWGPGDMQLTQRIIDRARAGRLVLVGSGLALIDTTYIDNAATAIVAGIDNAERAAGHALVISNGQPRTVSEIIKRMLHAGGLPTRLRHVPSPVAIAAGAAIETVWDLLDKSDEPPMTRFLAEQLATAHWFDQRQTRELLNWKPEVGLDEGFRQLADSLR